MTEPKVTQFKVCQDIDIAIDGDFKFIEGKVKAKAGTEKKEITNDEAGYLLDLVVAKCPHPGVKVDNKGTEIPAKVEKAQSCCGDNDTNKACQLITALVERGYYKAALKIRNQFLLQGNKLPLNAITESILTSHYESTMALLFEKNLKKFLSRC
ncbi:MAG: hypothetical protein JW841_08685 [Deltaproteobacteria bacterium]|nr:hypothetical protein [Deltaproteobacteria bacterium]